MNARDAAIAKLAELTKTPVFVVRAAFDEFALVAHDQAAVERYARVHESADATAIAERAVAQLVKMAG
jgi:hypothetical protein